MKYYRSLAFSLTFLGAALAGFMGCTSSEAPPTPDESLEAFESEIEMPEELPVDQ